MTKQELNKRIDYLERALKEKTKFKNIVTIRLEGLKYRRDNPVRYWLREKIRELFERNFG